MDTNLLEIAKEMIGINLDAKKLGIIGCLSISAYGSYQYLKYKNLTKILNYINKDIYNPLNLTKHTWISGVQGSGKSNKLRRIFINSFVKQGWGGIYIDTHGTADEVLRSIPKERWDDVIYIAPWMKRVYGINALQRYSDSPGEIDRIAEDVVQIFHKMYPRSWGDKLANAIRFATKAVLIANQNPTLLDVHKILTNEEFRNRTFRYVDNEIITNFLDNLKGTSAQDKLGNPLSSENIMLFLCQDNGLNMLELMENKKIIICNLDKDQLSENANLMAGVLVSIIAQCSAKRKGEASPDKHPYFALAMDEFYEYANKHINVLIEQMRKKNICVILANQNRDQIPTSVQSAVAMCQNKFIYTVADEDLSWVSNLYKKWFTKEMLVSIPFYSCVTDIHVAGKIRNPKIKMQPPYLPDNNWDYVKELKYYSLGKAKNRIDIIQSIKTKMKTVILDEHEKIDFSGELKF